MMQGLSNEKLEKTKDSKFAVKQQLRNNAAEDAMRCYWMRKNLDVKKSAGRGEQRPTHLLRLRKIVYLFAI
jgi:hypothetical protein